MQNVAAPLRILIPNLPPLPPQKYCWKYRSSAFRSVASVWAGSSSPWHETDGHLWPRRAALHQPSLFLIAALPHLSHDACYVPQEVGLSQETQRSEPVKLQRDSPIYFSMSRAWSSAFLPACSLGRTRRFFCRGFQIVKNVGVCEKCRCFFIELSSLFWCENQTCFVSFNEKNKSSKSMAHIRCSQSAFRVLSHESCLLVVESTTKTFMVQICVQK